MSKKKLFVMTALVVILAILGTGTLAYFTTYAITHNVITTGGVDIELNEVFPGADENNRLDGVMPGDPVDKVVSVINHDADAWIRVKVEVTYQGQPVDPKVVSLDYNLADWTEGEENIYYYNTIVKTGEETTRLFTQVTLSGENMGNEYQNAEIVVDVQAQGVQAANNPPQVEDDVTTVQGWPNFK